MAKVGVSKATKEAVIACSIVVADAAERHDELVPQAFSMTVMDTLAFVFIQVTAATTGMSWQEILRGHTDNVRHFLEQSEASEVPPQ